MELHLALVQVDKDTGRSLFVISLLALLVLQARRAADCCADLSLSLDLEALESKTNDLNEDSRCRVSEIQPLRTLCLTLSQCTKS